MKTKPSAGEQLAQLKLDRKLWWARRRKKASELCVILLMAAGVVTVTMTLIGGGFAFGMMERGWTTTKLNTYSERVDRLTSKVEQMQFHESYLIGDLKATRAQADRLEARVLFLETNKPAAPTPLPSVNPLLMPSLGPLLMTNDLRWLTNFWITNLCVTNTWELHPNTVSNGIWLRR